MVKPVRKAEISSFVKGLITEASPLNFPPQASRLEENYVLNIDGSRQRRLGIDFETNAVFEDAVYDASSISSVSQSTFKWVGAGRDSNKEILVVQIGLTLAFYDLTKLNLSQEGFMDKIVITGTILPTTPFSFSVVDGFLVVTTGQPEINIIEWDGTTFSQSTDRLKIRDQFGIDDGYIGENINKRVPTTESASVIDRHLYNLDNQGWGIKRRYISVDAELNVTGDTYVDPPHFAASSLSKYPANSERVVSVLGYQPVKSQTPNEIIFVDRLNEVFGLQGKAPQGYFIIDALDRGASRKERFLSNQTEQALSGRVGNYFNEDKTVGGPSLSTEFSGRVFFTGFSGEVTNPENTTPDLSSYVLFSQVVKNKETIRKCYQEGDPTSREESDIVETDGGFIRLSGMSNPIGMFSMGTSLFVLAQNGLWKITGGSDYGFTATNYKVDKISNFGSYSRDSIVEIGDKTFYWGLEGIFVVAKNQFGEYVATNLSEGTIQSYYFDIPPLDRKNVKSFYDQEKKEIRWIYGFNKEVNGTSTVKELVLHTTLGSFSTFKFFNDSLSSVEIIGYAAKITSIETSTVFNIVAGVDTVVVGTDNVTLTEIEAIPTSSPLKYLVLKKTGSAITFSFAELNNTEFVDWESVDNIGVDAKAFILTGTITAGDSAVNKFTPYLVVHFQRTESGVVEVGGELIPNKQSGCLIRSQWDWSDSTVSGKWSNLFQAYRYRRPLFITGINDTYDNGFEVVSSKNKLRGSGKALSIYFETEPKKDCIILGWNLSITGNSLA